MTVELKPEQQRVIDLAIQSGGFRDPEEVIDQALEIIREQLESQEWMSAQRDDVERKIAAGFAQSERGELTDGQIVLARLQRLRAERLKAR
jgi:antitoxin ParD1/3/4